MRPGSQGQEKDTSTDIIAQQRIHRRPQHQLSQQERTFQQGQDKVGATVSPPYICDGRNDEQQDNQLAWRNNRNKPLQPARASNTIIGLALCRCARI